jgi:hypothetical protein
VNNLRVNHTKPGVNASIEDWNPGRIVWAASEVHQQTKAHTALKALPRRM